MADIQLNKLELEDPSGQKYVVDKFNSTDSGLVSANDKTYSAVLTNDNAWKEQIFVIGSNCTRSGSTITVNKSVTFKQNDIIKVYFPSTITGNITSLRLSTGTSSYAIETVNGSIKSIKNGSTYYLVTSGACIEAYFTGSKFLVISSTYQCRFRDNFSMRTFNFEGSYNLDIRYGNFAIGDAFDSNFKVIKVDGSGLYLWGYDFNQGTNNDFGTSMNRIPDILNGDYSATSAFQDRIVSVELLGMGITDVEPYSRNSGPGSVQDFISNSIKGRYPYFKDDDKWLDTFVGTYSYHYDSFAYDWRSVLSVNSEGTFIEHSDNGHPFRPVVKIH